LEKTKDFAIFAGENSYNEIINDDSIDALYIPLPTTLHYDYIKLALSVGKHVLVEKPVATSHHEYVKMIQAAVSNQKYLMDGTMFVHNPRTQQVIDYLEENDINITRVQSEFTFMGDESFFTSNIRISQNCDMFGCIGDLGWYCIRMALLAFRCPATEAQVVHFQLNDDDVPIDASCFVYFRERGEKDEKILSFHCSFLHPLTQTVTMFGKDKSISMDDFVIPREEGGKDKNLSFDVKSQSLSHADLYSLHSDERIISTPINNAMFNPPQEVLMWNNFFKFCRGIDNEDINAKKEIYMSIQNQCIVDALMKSIQKNGEKISIASVNCGY
jgi:predicted dehydrogenase